jgi:hypothetical protein
VTQWQAPASRRGAGERGRHRAQYGAAIDLYRAVAAQDREPEAKRRAREALVDKDGNGRVTMREILPVLFSQLEDAESD